MSSIPIPRLIEMIDDLKHPLLMDSILEEHYVREHKKVHESARSAKTKKK